MNLVRARRGEPRVCRTPAVDFTAMSDHTDERETFHHDPIGHAEARAGMTVGELANSYGEAGIGASDIHEAVDIYSQMLDDDVTTFFGLAGAMVPTGMRAIVSELIRDGHIDVLVTTGANCTHDASRPSAASTTTAR